MPGLIARRPLHLDDRRTEVGEQHGAVRPREDAREVRDQQPGERAGRVTRLLSLSKHAHRNAPIPVRC